MVASLILGFILVCILGFYSLVRLQMASCEGGVYYAPLDSAEDWSASLDVALGLDMWSGTEEEQVDAMWDMVPMPMPMVHTPPMVKRTMVRACPTYTLRTLAYICMC